MVEDENGNIVRETMKDTDTLARYKTMHETLVYLSHLDHDDTESQMLEKLRLQVSRAGEPLHALHMTGRGWEPGSLAESTWEHHAAANLMQQLDVLCGSDGTHVWFRRPLPLSHAREALLCSLQLQSASWGALHMFCQEIGSIRIWLLKSPLQPVDSSADFPWALPRS